jgi:hypothetical protein
VTNCNIQFTKLNMNQHFTRNRLLTNSFFYFSRLTRTAFKFQENLLKTMMQIENTYFELAKTSKRNCLVSTYVRELIEIKLIDVYLVFINRSSWIVA